MKASQLHIKTNCTQWLTAGLLTIVSFSLSAASIVGSRHDLTTSVGGSAEVCVFCHTPHGSDTAASVPLWNKVLGTGAGYTRYSALGTASLDGEEATTVGSVSLACLSCHDGAQSRDVVINAPGSTATDTTLYDIAGVAMNGGAKFMTNDGTDKVPMLGTDLSDDHPISIQYAGGGCDSTDSPGTCPGTLGDPDFNKPELATINGNPQWWVDEVSGTSGTREKTDMMLYARTISGVLQPSVECGSCHDPHNADTFDATVGSQSVAFLRVKNTASVVCTSCHAK